MKVYFYLDNINLKNIDFSRPECGNPGIGGTPFMIWSVSCYLQRLYENIDVTILAPVTDNMPKDISTIRCNSLSEAIYVAKENKADIFIFRGPINDSKIFKLIDQLQLKSIMWSHNFEGIECLEYATSCQYLKRNICVSQEQLDRIRDHEIFSKSTFIHNCINVDDYCRRAEKKENIVCYLGSIDETKGFHKVAEVWKDILKYVPDAKLFVIGNAKLYNTENKLGKYQIAEESYEQKFIDYLLDENKNLLKSVNFCGRLGEKEKINIMNRAKVGVVNPTGVGETFCISAIEFQALRIPVVSSNSNGLLETVLNKKTGILVNNNKALRKSIVELLLNEEKNKRLGRKGEEFVKESFNIDLICKKWIRVIDDVYNDIVQKENISTKNYFSNFKWLRELNRIFKKSLHLHKLPSILEYRVRIIKLFKSSYSLIKK